MNASDSIFDTFDADLVVWTGRLVLAASRAEAAIGELVAALGDERDAENAWQSGIPLSETVERIASRSADQDEELFWIAGELRKLTDFRNRVVHGEVLLAGSQFAVNSKRKKKKTVDGSPRFPESDLTNASLTEYENFYRRYLELFGRVDRFIDLLFPSNVDRELINKNLSNLAARARGAAFVIPRWEVPREDS